MLKVLLVDLFRQSYEIEEIPKEWQALGGRALVSLYFTGKISPQVNAIGPENILVFAPGMLTGSTVAGVGRLSVGTKSPLSSTLLHSSKSSLIAEKLKSLGYALLVITGRSHDRDYLQLEISKDSVLIKPSGLVGLNNFEVAKILSKSFSRDSSFITIGKAGELKLVAASIGIFDGESERLSLIGRGGSGAVMAALGLKSIVVTSEIGGPSVSNSRAFSKSEKSLIKALSDIRTDDPGPRERGCSPICPLHCIFGLKAHPGYLDSKSVTQQKCPDDNNTLDRTSLKSFYYLCDDLGLDSVEAEAVLAIMIKAKRFKSGDSEKLLALVEGINEGTATGRIIGSGRLMAQKIYGVEDSLSKLQKNEISAKQLRAKIGALFADSLGLCSFVAHYMLDSEKALKALAELLAAQQGRKVEPEFVAEFGGRVLQCEEMFDARAQGRLPLSDSGSDTNLI